MEQGKEVDLTLAALKAGDKEKGEKILAQRGGIILRDSDLAALRKRIRNGKQPVLLCYKCDTSEVYETSDLSIEGLAELYAKIGDQIERVYQYNPRFVFAEKKTGEIAGISAETREKADNI